MPPQWSHALARSTTLARRLTSLRYALATVGIVALASSTVVARTHHTQHVVAATSPGPVRVARSAAPAGGVVLANATWDSPVLTPAVVRAIRVAARETGVDPNLLLAIAWRESRFDPEARNRRSSARGLLQFTTATWLQSFRDYGAKHGFARYAASIEKAPSGVLTVRSRPVRTAILKLRDDPVLSAALAAESMAHQQAILESQLGRGAASADLYLLHVLGMSGTVRFLTTLRERPSASSLEIANGETLGNAGLLTSTHTAMSVARTYAAVRSLLNEQRARSETLLAARETLPRAGVAKLIQVSEAP